MNLNGLRCTACGGELEMEVAFDGMSDKAVRYHPIDPEWGWVVQLCCTKCPRVYRIARVSESYNVSAIKENNATCRKVESE